MLKLVSFHIQAHLNAFLQILEYFSEICLGPLARESPCRNQKHYSLRQRLHWYRYDWNVISPYSLVLTKWVWRMKDQLDVTCYLFHFLCAQHVSDINISIIRSLRLCCWITVVLQPAKRAPLKTSRNKNSSTQRTENKTTDVVIHQNSRKLLKMDILMSETCWAHNKGNK